jgi:putative transposase
MPVQHRNANKKVHKNISCPHCDAPSDFLYFNDGKRRQQILCKVCGVLFQIDKKFRKPKTKYWCPHCGYALYRWKEQKLVTIYKCDNDRCPAYVSALNKLNTPEKELRKAKASQFKLRYQYRDYHFIKEQLEHSKPDPLKVDLDKIHNSPNVLGLALTFHVSFAITARKTALILKDVFNISISYQTVLNYAESAAPYCHLFNLKYKGDIDDISAGDETYIKITGKHAFTFFFISTNNHKITAYHLDHSRGTLPATVAMLEACRTSKPDQEILYITDGNPAYPAGIHYINEQRDPNNPIKHRKVIGLQNLDEESSLYRHYKQIIERLNRTYKFHIRNAYGFNNFNGAVSLTTLFVTHYNFLRRHIALKYKTPVCLPELESINTIQGKWCRIIELAKHIAPLEYNSFNL